MTNQDNLTEYANPEIYDLENSHFTPDGPFLLEFARRAGNPVLELGCGTGRLTIPFAEQGVRITGVDVVPGMIELARHKAKGLSVEWIVADARVLDLNRQFRMIFESGSVFQHMLTRQDQEAFLACVRKHLDPAGLFVFGTLLPHADLLAGAEEEKPWFTTSHPEGYEIHVSGTDSYDPLRQVKLETAYRRWTDLHGKDHVQVAPLSLRYTFPQELETLLHYNGLEVVERYGDHDFSPLTQESHLQIYVCRRQG